MELSSFYGPTHLINMNGWAMTPWNTFPNMKSLVYAATQGFMTEKNKEEKDNIYGYAKKYFVTDKTGKVITPLALYPDTNIFFVDYDRQAYEPMLNGSTNEYGNNHGTLVNFIWDLSYIPSEDLKQYSTDFRDETEAKVVGFPSWYKINYEIDKKFHKKENGVTKSNIINVVYYHFADNDVTYKKIYISAPFERKISNYYNYEINGLKANSTIQKEGYDGTAFQLYPDGGAPFLQIVGSLDEQWPQIIVDTYSPQWYENQTENVILPAMDMDKSTPAEARIKMVAPPMFDEEVAVENKDQLEKDIVQDAYTYTTGSGINDFSVTLPWDSRQQTPYVDQEFTSDKVEGHKDTKKFNIDTAPLNRLVGILYNALYGTNGNISGTTRKRNTNYFPDTAIRSNIASPEDTKQYQEPYYNRRGILEALYCLIGFFNVFTKTENTKDSAEYWFDTNLREELTLFANWTKQIIYPLYSHLTLTEKPKHGDADKYGTQPKFPSINFTPTEVDNMEKQEVGDLKYPVASWLVKYDGVVREFYKQFEDETTQLAPTTRRLKQLITGLKDFYNWINNTYTIDEQLTFNNYRFPTYYKENYGVVKPFIYMFDANSAYRITKGRVNESDANYKDKHTSAELTADTNPEKFYDGYLNDELTNRYVRFERDDMNNKTLELKFKLDKTCEISGITIYYKRASDGTSFDFPDEISAKIIDASQNEIKLGTTTDISTSTATNATGIAKIYCSDFFSPPIGNTVLISFKLRKLGIEISEIKIHATPAVDTKLDFFSTPQQIGLGNFIQFYKRMEPFIQKMVENFSLDSDNTALFTAIKEISVDQWKFTSGEYRCEMDLVSPQTWDHYGMQIQKEFSVIEFAVDDNISDEELDEIIYNDIQIVDTHQGNSSSVFGSLIVNSNDNCYRTHVEFRASSQPQRPLKLSALITF